MPAAWENSGYAVTRWEMKDGLPLNKVRAVAQTPEGYLWVGTFNGLARFDGVRFSVFDVGNTPVLRHNGIEVLGVDSTGRLWIGNTVGGLSVLSGGQFQAIDLPSGWPAKPVLRIAASPRGAIWVVNEEAGRPAATTAVAARTSQPVCRRCGGHPMDRRRGSTTTA